MLSGWNTVEMGGRYGQRCRSAGGQGLSLSIARCDTMSAKAIAIGLERDKRATVNSDI